MADNLCKALPTLANRLPKTDLADLPTPVECRRMVVRGTGHSITIKRDDLTSQLYGGNKVRKLEYLLRRAKDRNAERVATIGTVASNHALATAMHATSLGFACTCFLTHQARSPKAPLALKMHLRCGTEIVPYGGSRAVRVATMRKYLQGRGAWLIPMGGSNWLGVVGFVNAGLELAAQITDGMAAPPSRLYVANGTMATAAGLALGLALAGLRTEVHAVRVTHDYVANTKAMQRLIGKTATLMRRLDNAVPADIAHRVRLVFRDEFFGGGYAQPTPEAEKAIHLARDQLELTLDSTYTGKAMAALLHDLQRPDTAGEPLLFWNTYNSRPLPVSANRPDDDSRLPREFLRYFD